MGPMRAKWRHVEYNLRNGGVRLVLKKLYFRAKEWLWSSSSWLIYQTRGSTSHPVSSSDLEYKVLQFDNLLSHQYEKALVFPEVIRSRLQSGGRCYGFYYDGEIANFAWVTDEAIEIDRSLSLDLPGSIAIFDCLTLPNYRGLGIYPKSLSILIRLGLDAGFKSVVIMVDPTNTPSIKGIERAGFLLESRLTRKRRFGISTVSRLRHGKIDDDAVSSNRTE